MARPPADGKGIAAEGAGLIDGTGGADLFHEFGSAPYAPTGRPPPMILPRQVMSGRT